MTKLLHYTKRVLGEFLREEVIWEVPVSEHFPEGLKYRFVLVYKGKRVLGYDNRYGEGHHKHLKEEKIAIKVCSRNDIFYLLKSFLREAENLRKSEGEESD